jgi:hypothetical protein
MKETDESMDKIDELIKINERITDELIKHYARTIPRTNAVVVDEPLGIYPIYLRCPVGACPMSVGSCVVMGSRQEEAR